MSKTKGTEKLELWKNEQVFLIDSREKKPLLIKPSKVVGLPEGDYTLEGVQHSAIIERKSLNDLIGSLTYGRNRFFRELHRMDSYDLRAIIVDDASWGDLFNGNYRSQASPDSMVGSVMSIIVDFKMPIIFCGDRKMAAKIVRKLLLYYKLKYAGDYKDVIDAGTRFGKLTTNFKTSLKAYDKTCYWLCSCDCGRDTLVATSVLKNKTVQSCGCLFKETFEKYSFDEAVIQVSFNKYKRSAEKRGHGFSLDIKQFTVLVTGDCKYCGSPPMEYPMYKRKEAPALSLLTGIDRVDNSVGYVSTNCVSCCKFCNMMKHAYPEKFFLEHIKKIYKHNNEE